jgi:hypothetical protein
MFWGLRLRRSRPDHPHHFKRSGLQVCLGTGTLRASGRPYVGYAEWEIVGGQIEPLTIVVLVIETLVFQFHLRD